MSAVIFTRWEVNNTKTDFISIKAVKIHTMNRQFKLLFHSMMLSYHHFIDLLDNWYKMKHIKLHVFHPFCVIRWVSIMRKSYFNLFSEIIESLKCGKVRNNQKSGHTSLPRDKTQNSFNSLSELPSLIGFSLNFSIKYSKLLEEKNLSRDFQTVTRNEFIVNKNSLLFLFK